MISGLIVIFGIIAMVMIHETGHFIAAKATGMKATEFFFGFGPRLWSTQRGETEYGVKAIPLGGYVRIVGMNLYEEVDPADEGRTYREKPFWKKTVVVLAGVATHFVVAYLLFYLVLVGTGYDVVSSANVVGSVEATLAGTDTPTPAAVAGLREGDVIVALDGVQTPTWGELVDEIAAAGPGETVTLTVEREQARLELEVALAENPRDETLGYLGVGREVIRERVGAVAGVTEAGVEVGDAVVASAEGMWKLFSGIGNLIGSVVSGESVSDEVRPASPIGIYNLATGESIPFALQLLALVNVFVGLFNFIPIYPLDGGHFAVALYEKLRGRPADVRKLAPVAAAVVILLILLGVLAVYLDIADPFTLR
jgi:membrane-associated protease RseP (regulator of RpoE activity)